MSPLTCAMLHTLCKERKVLHLPTMFYCSQRLYSLEIKNNNKKNNSELKAKTTLLPSGGKCCSRRTTREHNVHLNYYQCGYYWKDDLLLPFQVDFVMTMHFLKVFFFLFWLIQEYICIFSKMETRHHDQGEHYCFSKVQSPAVGAATFFFFSCHGRR